MIMTKLTSMLAMYLFAAVASLLIWVAPNINCLEIPKSPPSESIITSDELVRIYESPKPIEYFGIKQHIAPESKVVAIHFDVHHQAAIQQQKQQHVALDGSSNLFLSPLLSSSSSQKGQKPSKQSQEFDIGNQQERIPTSDPTSQPIAEIVGVSGDQTSSSTSNTTDSDCKPSTQDSTNLSTTPTPTTTTTTTSDAGNGIDISEQASSTVAPITTTTSSTSSTASTTTSTATATTTTTTAATTPGTPEPSNIVIDAPVGTKTTRQGDAVYCGEANPNGKSNKRLVLDRIVGGRKTEPGEFPFQVRLNIRSRRGSGICGGVILDKYHILTAAHCMTACASQYLITATIENSGVHATIGDHSIKSNDGEVEIDVDKIIPHEKYDACNFYANDHDIALIKTQSPIEYRFTTDGYGSINRPCMPKDASLSYREGESVIVSGWGVTRENSGSLSNILRYVQVPIVNTTKCQDVYGGRVTKDHVCAGYQTGGKDSCQGDSGGPLVRVVDNRYELVGIVSFGYGCGQPGAPGVYTRVASYIDWIKANLS